MKLSKIESGIRTVIAFNEALNRHDVDGMMALMSDDCVFENTSPAPDGTVYRGRADVTQFWRDFFRQSPQARIEVEEIFGLGFRVVMRWRYEWVDPAGQAGHVRGVDIYQLRGGRITGKLSYVKG
jgi:ketosteroid isomerase-like protein